jgi:hypothetical protein
VGGGILFPRNEEKQEGFGKVELPASPTLEAGRNIGEKKGAWPSPYLFNPFSFPKVGRLVRLSCSF